MSAMIRFILVASVIGTILTAPTQPPEDLEQVLYDQRQNGTDNVRLMVNDFTLLVAPSEGLLSFAPSALFGDLVTPKESNPNRSRSGLTKLLANMFRRNQDGNVT
ncbi:hypothetical protein O3M35_001309 [Rhynocoris fuscipes]|uniref:Uncharacterized protein n=1 Tax=Rhynocoris fuscipes TaxID=488301 RepID=A0AAW1DQQ7_9HEMI